jgi:hypothetical protein
MLTLMRTTTATTQPIKVTASSMRSQAKALNGMTPTTMGTVIILHLRSNLMRA